jgi:UDP-N-acetylmuramoylalanine--D-glutamate ligase
MAIGFSVLNKRAVVLGAGRSGVAAARLLVSRGATVTLADTRPRLDQQAELQRAGIAVELGPHRPELLAAADVIVLSPGVPPRQDAIDAARAAGVLVIGEVELASRWLKGRVVAITGTKGKSTTTTLVARMLDAGGLLVTAGGNLGTALSEQVAGTRSDIVHVVEVSSFQLETADTFHPWIAVLVNLSPDHLDRHASFDEYAAAKARIFAHQSPTDWAVVNGDDAGAMALAEGASARRFDFAFDRVLDNGVTVEDGHIVVRRNGASTPVVPVSSVRVPGRHLLADVMAATAVATLAGVTPEAVRRAVEGFTGLEHALEHVADIDGVRFVNDSKATNVVSARRAIESFDNGVVVIMGGRYKGGEFSDLRDVALPRVRAIVAIGEASDRIASALGDAVPVERASSMRDAVDRAFGRAVPGGVVLLAPACSSFDMFEDYAARGRAFKSEVARIGAETGRRLGA